MVEDEAVLRRVTELCIEGCDSGRIAIELGLDLESARRAEARVDAVLLLLAKSFPPYIIPRAARLATWEVDVVLELVRARVKTAARLFALVEERGLDRPESPGSQAAEAAPLEPRIGEEAGAALDVLEFWTGRWD